MKKIHTVGEHADHGPGVGPVGPRPQQGGRTQGTGEDQLPTFILQGDQLNMAVFFWYLVNSYWTSVNYCACVQCIQATFYEVLEKHRHV